MTRRALILSAGLMLWICFANHSIVFADGQMDQPIDGDRFTRTSPISCTGIIGDAPNSVTIKLKNSVGVIVDSKSEFVDGMGQTGWIIELDPSDVGGAWSTGTYTVEAWEGSTKIGSASISIVP